MIQYQFFPRSNGISREMEDIINCFKQTECAISSDTNEISSNEVLAIVRPLLEELGYKVERGKNNEAKIDVPVLFGKNNNIDKSFYADAVSADGRIVIEIEAGRATESNQFLKDLFEACMMHNVEYLVLVVRNVYRKHKDFEIIYTFFETMYISNRLKLPLKGIMLIGY